MLVTLENHHRIRQHIRLQRYISLDCETTGLDVYGGDGIVGISITTPNNSFYFNETGIGFLHGCFATGQTIYIHNAKFDLSFLKQIGIDLAIHNVHCTYVLGRVERNDRLSCGLDALAREIGEQKSGDIKEYMTKHKLFEWITRPGKKKREKRFFYHQVPLEVLMPYCEHDSRIGYRIGLKQSEFFMNQPEMSALVANETELIPVLMQMEQHGIKIDRNYTQIALEYETTRYEKAAEAFFSLTGTPFKDSNKILAAAFSQAGISYGLTEKGNPSFDAKALKGMDSQLANIVKEHREAYKKAGTYYQNFLQLADENNILHCNFKQAGCKTGRLSCADPNLQNVPKRGEDLSPFPVRKCFVPRGTFNFFMIDYNQMEYILLMDYAEEMSIIEQVRAGVDVHDATAEMLGITRSHAKTINFALLYGCGADHLAEMLGTSVAEAKYLRNRYFARLPKIKAFIDRVIDTAKRRGYVYNWLKRRYYFDDQESAYKAPNYLIQGGCADIIKMAMVRIHHLLKAYQSRMLLQVHDELVFEIAHGEEFLIPKIVAIMEGIRTPKHLPLTVSVEYSSKSWHDKEEYDCAVLCA